MLVGDAAGKLAKLYQRNDHPRVKSRGWDPFENADPPDYPFSDEYWDRFFARCKQLLTKGSEWNYVNTWHPLEGLIIQVHRRVDTGEYLHIAEKAVDSRFSLLIRSDSTRMRVTSSKAEQKARTELLKHLNGRQRRELLLTGAFVEVSRSDVHYRITSGRPTVAYRSEEVSDRYKSIQFLAAMCLHPLGYYEDTFTGCLPPSDEMLAHLLMIRSSEHYFWRKATQHGIKDPRVGF